eukprot:2881314-Pleurochrysis_carterae.AAC.1
MYEPDTEQLKFDYARPNYWEVEVRVEWQTCGRYEQLSRVHVFKEWPQMIFSKYKSQKTDSNFPFLCPPPQSKKCGCLLRHRQNSKHVETTSCSSKSTSSSAHSSRIRDIPIRDVRSVRVARAANQYQQAQRKTISSVLNGGTRLLQRLWLILSECHVGGHAL